jgi:hypothetical protein
MFKFEISLFFFQWPSIWVSSSWGTQPATMCCSFSVIRGARVVISMDVSNFTPQIWNIQALFYVNCVRTLFSLKLRDWFEYHHNQHFRGSIFLQTLVTIYQTTQHHISEYGNHHSFQSIISHKRLICYIFEAFIATIYSEVFLGDQPC